MTRLDRILELFEEYELVIRLAVPNDTTKSIARWLERLRAEKDQLTQELIEHGCRRKN